MEQKGYDRIFMIEFKAIDFNISILLSDSIYASFSLSLLSLSLSLAPFFPLMANVTYLQYLLFTFL